MIMAVPWAITLKDVGKFVKIKNDEVKLWASYEMAMQSKT